ncbi:hypothetical protein GO496_10685 [Acidovorax citrulli]|nr:hypothetical protein [Paracidovorax citrulli]
MTRTHRQIGRGVESISQQLARPQSSYVALQGIQGFKAMALDLAAKADQVNNLQGRIKLVTGENENFAKSWQGRHRGGSAHPQRARGRRACCSRA